MKILVIGVALGICMNLDPATGYTQTSQLCKISDGTCTFPYVKVTADLGGNRNLDYCMLAHTLPYDEQSVI